MLGRNVNREYTYVIEPLSEEDGRGYVAYHPELGKSKVCAFGETPQAAIARLDASRDLWLACDGRRCREATRLFSR